MKTTCPSCSSAYRVADEKVPDIGAQIKCPKCGTMFVVRRPPPEPKPQQLPQKPAPSGEAPSSAPASMSISLKHEQSTPLQALMGDAAPPKPGTKAAPPPPSSPVELQGSKTPNLDRLEGEALVSTGNSSSAFPTEGSAKAQRVGMSAIRAQSGARPAGHMDLLATYRVRTSRGLTYDFPSRAALKKWLAEREDLSGCEVAEPDGDWMPMEKFLAGAEMERPKTPGVAGRDTQAEPTPDAAQPSIFPTLPPGQPLHPSLAHAAEPGSQSGTAPAKKDWVAWILTTMAILSTLCVLFTLAASLTRYGVVDLSAVLPLQAVGVEYPGSEGSKPIKEISIVTAQADPEVIYRKALQAARRSMRAKRFSRAALEYNRALSIHPGSVEALEGLAKAYNGLGDRDRALAVQKKARDIQIR